MTNAMLCLVCRHPAFGKCPRENRWSHHRHQSTISTTTSGSSRPRNDQCRSKMAYQRAWTTFCHFSNSYLSPDKDWHAVSPSEFLLFIAYLKCNGMAPASITSTISEVGYIYQFKGLPNPANQFLVQRAMSGLRKMEPNKPQNSSYTYQHCRYPL